MSSGLNSPVTDIKGVGSKYGEVLHKNQIFTINDFLLHFPTTYIDFSSDYPGIDLERPQVYRIQIENINLSRLYRRKLSILKISGFLAGESIQVTLFNQPYLFNSLKNCTELIIYGKIERKGGSLQSNSPRVFTGPIERPVLPVYKAIASLKPGKIRNLVENAFAMLEEEEDDLPQELVLKHRFPPRIIALKSIHQPQELLWEEIYKLKGRFIYQEFLHFQLQLQYTRNHFKKVKRSRFYNLGNNVREAIAESLSFELTPDQVKSYTEIVTDFKSETSMQRLLQGDVGSGKTVVAFLALLVAVENGYQGTVLAPTEILSQQHFQNSKTFFKKARTELLTGSTPAKKRKEILKRLKEGEVDILFGTHALLHQSIAFKELSLVVIDEQHRFGVAQRAALYYKGHNADVLVTTATPIPRTLLLSMYNDLSVSTIKTKPQGRRPVITREIQRQQRDSFYKNLKQKIEKGEKTYIILPLVEDSEFFEGLRSLESETGYFEKQFQGIPLGMVSGQTPAIEKDRVLRDFAEGKIRILVATTVIEVGIDISDATLIVIEEADRYGLSQLHQLRGRVGRGNTQSYCYLLPSKNLSENGRLRLDTLVSTNDGFEIAETDLRMRGGGIISGQAQSGSLDFKVGDVREDYPIFKQAGQDAVLVLKKKTLQTPAIKDILEKVHRELRSINFS